MTVTREMRGTQNPEGMTGFDGEYHPFGVEDKPLPNLQSGHPFGVAENNCKMFQPV